ncbi:triose-phosphate isomerase [Sphingorhabdus sp.]|jgi:triosephosphate isomerase|uniref:triose-phosphate isomerase n=1 Tax=Sphingorhabdus sp. TaxID=1902408 RepID=UPI0037C8EE0C
MRKLVVGNWKMNGVTSDLAEIAAIAEKSLHYPAVDSALCLPATLINRACDNAHSFPIGGQDCHMQASGAHTGCVSADMLVDAGASLVIVGHSERRAAQHEQDHDVLAKAQAAHKAGLKAIICVGETLAERDAGNALNIVLGQVAGSLPENISGDWLSVAYEPVWAIGTGRIPEMADVREMHGAIRSALVDRYGAVGNSVRILYGGSMNGDNAAELLAVENVDGGLIGGASLTCAKFEPILAAAQAFGE